MAESEALIEKLLDADLLELVESDDSLIPCDRFQRKRVQNYERVKRWDDDELRVGMSELVPEFAELGIEESPKLLAITRTVDEMTHEFASEELLSVSLALGKFTDTSPTSGVPEGFTTLGGWEIRPFLIRHNCAILYFWREDCEPCDLVRRNLESLLADGAIPEHFGLGAIYGPDCPSSTLEEYSVGVGPTLLFCQGETVDSRLIGGHHVDVIESEVTTLAEICEV